MYWLSRKNSPDLIIADPQLPDMENWELIHQLSTSGLYGNIPIIALSGLEKSETDSKCLSFGIEKYFLKPFNPVELLLAVNDVLSRKLSNGDFTLKAS